MRAPALWRSLLAGTLALLVAFPAGAWNETGHRVVAAIAYDNLTPAVRIRVDALIRRHPDYAGIFAEGAAGDARASFIAASYWPDLIRNDPRFYNDTQANARPTRLLPGFPNMGRHTNWHYYDVPFSQDGTRTEQQRPPHALSEIQRLLRVVRGRDRPQATYALPWLLHLVGDIHNPLHATSRFSRQHPHGDRGGNLVYVKPGGNLHSLWDGLAGSDTSAGSVDRYAADAAREYRAKGNASVERAEKNPRKWIDESSRLAKGNVYTFGLSSGSRQQPIVLPQSYAENAKRLAKEQLALAGFRLAAVLNAALAP